MQNCIFCKIIAKTLPATIFKETDSLIVINDIQPQAPIHQLIIPKKHLPNLMNFESSDFALGSEIFAMAQTLAQAHNVASFRLINNNGHQAGQSVFHIHVHFLAGKTLVF